MNVSQREAAELIESSDIKFVRLAFCDVFGVQKNISVQASELERAFLQGIAFDASSIAGFRDPSHSDLFLFPDPETMTLLPWRPSRGGVARFFCEIRNPDGSPFSADCRKFLADTEHLLAEHDLRCDVGAECEFYLFKLDENGNPTDIPIDRAGYFDIAPADCCENVRREICQTLEAMGIQPERSHHEQGPGQNEIDFRYSNALSAADNVVTFKQVVSTVAARNGLWASFSPKPIAGEAGNGFHINCSITHADIRAATDESLFRSFMAGVLAHTPEMTAVLNPLAESYARLGMDKAPNRVSWSPSNRSQLIRIPASDASHQRMELRSPDASCNPYLAFALVMRAGLDGILSGMTPPPPCNENLLLCSQKIKEQYRELPSDLVAARRLAAESKFMQDVLPAHLLTAYTE
ncbi:MAG: glutamine synthetase family protein [Oscillospiraceae bacterium]|nr:glutamine synthetase family protein [Oscillospiraceae bacterium]